MITRRSDRLAMPALLVALTQAVPATLAAASASAQAGQAGPGVGDVPQGTQSNASYAASFTAANVTDVDATSGQVSCYRPEDPYFANDGDPAQPAEAVAVAVRPHGATSATDWITTHGGHPDFVASYDSVGNEPDKQWLTIDDNPASPHYNRIYAMWVDFHTVTPVPFVSFADARADGTHTDWSAPQPLPEAPHVAQGATYLLPHVAPDGTIYTTLTNFSPKQGFCCSSVFVDKSADGGQTWSVAGTAVSSVTPPPLVYPNTTFCISMDWRTPRTVSKLG